MPSKKESSTAIDARKAREQSILLSHLRKVPIVSVACEQSGIGRATYYRWKKEDPVFSKAADEALAEGTNLVNDMAESQLLKAIRDGNLGAVMYWLKHRHPSYANRLQVTAELKQQALTPEQETLVLHALELLHITDPHPLPSATHEKE